MFNRRALSYLGIHVYGLASAAAGVMDFIWGDFDADHQPDLIPSFGTKLSMILANERGRVYVEKQAHGRADDPGSETTGGGTKGGRLGARGGRVEAHSLRLEGEVRRHGVSQAQEAKQLRDENTKLRKLVADLSLDKEAPQSVIRKNGWSS